MSKTENTDTIVKAIRSTVDRVAPGARVILFGSRARGTARPDSDWDVLVLLDKSRITGRDQDDVAYPLTELGWEMKEEINPVLFTKSYWDTHTYTPFHHNVTQEGIEL